MDAGTLIVERDGDNYIVSSPITIFFGIGATEDEARIDYIACEKTMMAMWDLDRLARPEVYAADAPWRSVKGSGDAP